MPRFLDKPLCGCNPNGPPHTAPEGCPAFAQLSPSEMRFAQDVFNPAPESVESKLTRLAAGCKGSVSVDFNGHRDCYEDLGAYLYEHYDEMITPTKAAILEAGEIVEVRFYPETPIGFYQVCGVTLAEAIDRAMEIFEAGRK